MAERKPADSAASAKSATWKASDNKSTKSATDSKTKCLEASIDTPGNSAQRASGDPAQCSGNQN